MLTALMVAEKPSLAESIAKILSNGHVTFFPNKSPKYTCRKSSMPVYEFEASLFGKQTFFKMTCTTGIISTFL